MQISSSTNTITLIGNIKTVNDFQDIKRSIDLIVKEYKDITLNIQDSLSITSSVIGYFNKIVLKDKINLNMNIGNEKLFNLINDLNLTSVFQAKKV